LGREHREGYTIRWSYKNQRSFMSINLYAESRSLLEKISNAIYERETSKPTLICFKTSDVQMVERWLEEFQLRLMIEKPASGDT
jgi:selenophosphate synthase